MKRSEFYAAMAIVIIMCSMSTVFAVSYQPQIIQPTKPYIAYLKQNTAADATFYTVVNVNGSGILNNIKMSNQGSSNVPNDKYSIKITIDGTAYTYVGSTAQGTQLYSNSFYFKSGVDGTYAFEMDSNCFFKSSLKVEIMQNSGGNAALDATVNYALE